MPSLIDSDLLWGKEWVLISSAHLLSLGKERKRTHITSDIIASSFHVCVCACVFLKVLRAFSWVQQKPFISLFLSQEIVILLLLFSPSLATFGGKLKK